MTEIYQKIVIATDGSEKNLSAVIEGLMIARVTGAKLQIIYVIDTKALTTGVIEESYAGMYDSLREEGEQALEQAKELAGDLDVETSLLTGKPATEIARFVKEHGSRPPGNRDSGENRPWKTHSRERRRNNCPDVPLFRACGEEILKSRISDKSCDLRLLIGLLF